VKAAKLLLAEEDALKKAEKNKRMQEIAAKLMEKYKGKI